MEPALQGRDDQALAGVAAFVLLAAMEPALQGRDDASRRTAIPIRPPGRNGARPSGAG